MKVSKPRRDTDIDEEAKANQSNGSSGNPTRSWRKSSSKRRLSAVMSSMVNEQSSESMKTTPAGVRSFRQVRSSVWSDD